MESKIRQSRGNRSVYIMGSGALINCINQCSCLCVGTLDCINYISNYYYDTGGNSIHAYECTGITS